MCGPALGVHVLWVLSDHSPCLTDEIVTRLAPYVTRWAKTLGVKVWAAGGTGNHLHLLLDLPFDRALQTVSDELRAATERFARETLGLSDFVWEYTLFVGVNAREKAELAEYIAENALHHAEETVRLEWETGDFNGYTEREADDTERLPEWLRQIMPRRDE